MQNTQTTLDSAVDEIHKKEQDLSTHLPPQKIEKKINEEVRRMMSELFSCIEPELLNFLTYHEKLDSVYVLLFT